MAEPEEGQAPACAPLDQQQPVDPSSCVPVEEPESTGSYKLQQFVFQPFSISKSIPQEHVPHPAPRAGHRIVADNDYVYLLGGYNQDITEPYLRYLERDPVWQQSKPIFRELWRFCKLTKTWARMNTTGECPVELISHCMALWDKNRKLLVYGGSGTLFGQANSNKLYLCDLRTFVWELVPVANDPTEEPSQIPKPGYGQAMAVDEENQTIYICGGTQGYEYTMDMHQFDFKTKKWKLLHPLNLHGRCHYEMALHDRKLFILGGANNEIVYGLDTIPTFHLDTNKWTLNESRPFGADIYPNARFAYGGAQFGNSYHLFGGAGVRNELADFWTLHLPDLTWQLHTVATASSPSPSPRFFFSLAISPDGQLALFGGGDKSRIRYNDIYEAWVTIPPLYEIARQAMIGNVKVSAEWKAKREADDPKPLISDPSEPSSSKSSKRKKRKKLSKKRRSKAKAKAAQAQVEEDADLAAAAPKYKIFTRERIEQFMREHEIPLRTNLFRLPGY